MPKTNCDAFQLLSLKTLHADSEPPAKDRGFGNMHSNTVTGGSKPLLWNGENQLDGQWFPPPALPL